MSYPTRLRRADSFLGIHFDFHAGPDCRQVGRGVTEAMGEGIIQKVHPDYIQCDCKGHPGFSSYPTKVGCPAPGFVGDPLRLWRKVTARRGVALFMHYSGVMDTQAVKRHSSWARVDEKGRHDKNKISVFGPYVDKLLIPQLVELRGVYGVDGVWVDGDCWAAACDYSPQVLRAFREATGIHSVPRRPEDPHFFEFSEFCREGFRQYLRHYVEALHWYDPEFQIASNWAFSSHMPEPVSAPVDFLSGDYPLRDSFRTARFEARALMHQGRPWDLMAWGFAARWKEMDAAATKTAVQLQQESAVVLALGGGFQVYYKQDRQGSIYDWTMDVMREVARFCRARQKVCHHGQSVPQVALLNSTTHHYRESRNLFGSFITALRGTLDALLDNQQHVDVLSEHHFLKRPMAGYPLIILPECEGLSPAFRTELLAYVRAGGNLLVVGPRTAQPFSRELGVTFKASAAKTGWHLQNGNMLAAINVAYAPITLQTGSRAMARVYPENRVTNRGQVAASVRRLGRGLIAGIYLNVGEIYRQSRTTVLRDFIGEIVRTLHRAPMVEVQGSHYVDVTVMRQESVLCVNLVNSAGPHADEGVYTFDEVPPVGPLHIAIRHPRPRQVQVEPGGHKIPFRYCQGRIMVTLPRLEIHASITIV